MNVTVPLVPKEIYTSVDFSTGEPVVWIPRGDLPTKDRYSYELNITDGELVLLRGKSNPRLGIILAITHLHPLWQDNGNDWEQQWVVEIL